MARHVYTRVSVKSQDVASQMSDLQAWEAAHGSCEWHTDTFTGKVMSRPGFESMMKAVKPGDSITIWRLDRLGRTASGLTRLFDELIKSKVNLISLKDGLDLSTPAGRLMANVLASVAQFETEVRAERVRAGQENARANGKPLGRPKGTGTRIKTTDDSASI